MKHLNLILVGLLAWFVPTFASAQLAPGEFVQLRSDDPRCGEGFTCFQVGPFLSGSDLSFDRMLRVVNRGVEEAQQVTILQLEAANPCGVMYTSPGRRPMVNGVCGRNGTTERVTYADYCDGASACSRWVFVGRVYRVPSVRILTPDERAEEMAREIANAVVTETVPAPSTLGANLRELIELRSSAQPPSDEHEVAALTAMADALDRTSASAPVEAPADMVFAPADAAGSDEPDALAAANARIAELEARLAERSSATNTTGYRIAIAFLGLLAAGLLIYLLFFSPRHKANEGLTDAARARERTNAKKAFERELGGTIPEIKSKLEKHAADELEADNAKSGIAAIREIFEKITGRSNGTVNEVGKWMKEAHEFVSVWKPLLAQTSPIELRDERTQAVKYRELNEVWKSVEGFNLGFTVGSLEKVVTGWLRYTQLQLEWAGLMPAFAVTEAPDGGLLDYVKLRQHEATSALIEQRDGFERQLIEHVDLFRQERETNERMSSRFEDILEALNDVTRGEFGSILMRAGTLRVVDPEKVRSRFAKERKVPGSKHRGQPREALVIHELQSLVLSDFLRTTHAGLMKVGDIACEALGRKPVVDHTPTPHALSVPEPHSLPSPASLPMTSAFADLEGTGANDASWEDEASEEGEQPDPEDLLKGVAPSAPPVPQGMGTDSLLDHPPEEETVERSSSMDAALKDALEFSQTRAHDESDAEESALQSEQTFVGKAPLAPDSTQPFAREPIEGSGNGHSVHGKRPPSRDDEVTQQVDLRADGRPRRITERGMMAAPSDAKSPEPPPVTDPPSAGE